MSGIPEVILRARASGDLSEVAEAIPYAAFLGISMQKADGRVRGKLTYSEHLVGNPLIPALHGGTIGALLESIAVFTLLMEAEALRVPKTISITIDFLRTGRAQDTYARAEITKLGRRVASVRAFAWQDDPENPIAIANTHLLVEPER